jgi:hypothetical protein
MLRTEWFTFAAPPKCGNQWFKAMMKDQQIEWLESSTNDAHHPGSVEGLASITTQRPVYDWLYSYYRRVTGPISVPQIDVFHDTLRTVESVLDSFEYFALRYIDLMPGRITELYEVVYKSQITLQLEGLGFGTAAAFGMLGVPHDPEAVQNFPLVDATPNKEPISDDLKLAIMEVG